MARPKNTSRITPKGTRPDGTRVETPTFVGGGDSSPGWLGWLIAVSFVVGLVLVVSNYMSWLPGSPSSAWILGGLGFVLVGILAATRWR